MFDLSTSLKALATVFFLIATRWIYRITLHPLAKFPGPKLAAMTSIYSMSYDLPLRTSYVKQFAKWHQQYASPIIRIEPNHLHILDMDAYNQVFRVGTPFSRDPAMYSFPFTKGGLFNKLTVKEVKPHRDLYMPYFSRQNVQKMEPIIRDHLSKFLIKLDEASYARHEVDLSLGFRCLNADTVMRYAFDKPYGALGSPNFEFPMM